MAWTLVPGTMRDNREMAAKGIRTALSYGAGQSSGRTGSNQTAYNALPCISRNLSAIRFAAICRIPQNAGRGPDLTTTNCGDAREPLSALVSGELHLHSNGRWCFTRKERIKVL